MPSNFLAGSPFTSFGPVPLVSDANEALFQVSTSGKKNKKSVTHPEEKSNILFVLNIFLFVFFNICMEKHKPREQYPVLKDPSV